MGSEQLQLFLLALAPSLFWLWWFWSQDRDRDELEPLARAFVFGAIAVLPCSIFEFALLSGSATPSTLQCFLIIGPLEELCKLMATLLAVGRDRNFDDPADGIVFGAAAALGFAFAENLYYFASHSTHVFVVRSGLSVPSHVLAAVPWAVALGKIKCDELAPKRLIVSGLIVASILHGMYDALCYQIHYQRDIAVIALLVFTLLEWRLYLLSMKETLRLGRRLIRRRMLASRTWKKQDPEVQSPAFNWRWCFIPMIAGLVIAAASWAGIFPLLKHGVLLPDHVDVVLVTVLMINTGIIAAYFSPGRTEKEAALGLALGGFCLSFTTGWPSHDPMESGIYFALLGAFGGWLGEMLQSQNRKLI